jgi:hypothetical protein
MEKHNLDGLAVKVDKYHANEIGEIQVMLK